MKPLSSPLQQYWQTVVERLPEPLAEESLSAQAKSVLTFSDFVQDSVIAHPEWLTELQSQPPQADEWQHYAAWLQEALSNVSDEAGLMRELRLFRRRGAAHSPGNADRCRPHGRSVHSGRAYRRS